MRVTVIATVLNEAASIQALLESLAAQTRPPDEVVIVDGGSRDGTPERVDAFALQAPFPVSVLRRPGANISAGRNAAISAAHCPLIAATDAGVRLEPHWLEALCAPFSQPQPPDVVSGFFVADPRSLFELALGAATLPRLEEIDPTRFSPSSRSVAFRKAAWQAVGGYPEWLDYCEDLVFDFALQDARFRFAFAPQALVHFRPRPSLRAFFRQYYRYARGDGKAGLYLLRHLIRYGAYLLAAPGAVALALLVHPAWWLALGLGAAAWMARPVRRILASTGSLAPLERLRALLWAPLIVVTGDVAKMLGYPVGVWWRRRHAPSAAGAPRRAL